MRGIESGFGLCYDGNRREKTGFHMELRENIIQCAVSCFEKDGLHFTMNDIAKNMHIAKKTIYSLFETKEDLLCAMLDTGFAKIHADKKRILESSLELPEKLEQVMIAMPDQYSLLDFRRLNELEGKYPKAYALLISHLENDWEPVNSLIEEGIRQGVLQDISIPLFRSIFTSSIESFLFGDVLEKEKISYGEALKELMRILMNGIRKDTHEKNQ